jgi:hypothetical protein
MTGRDGGTGGRTRQALPAPRDDGPGEEAAGIPRRAWKPPPETALQRMRRLARFTAMIEAWRSPGPDREALTAAEQDLLAVAHLSAERGTSLLIRLPGGLHRLPLMAAAMIAAGSLDVPEAELTRLSGPDPPPGPVALVTARTIRRGELDRLDASSAPVAPALHPHRLRGDGLMAPMRGGRPRLVTGAARMLFVTPVTGFPAVLGVAPRVVVIDAASEAECDWLTAARNWASAHGSIVITVADLHHRIEGGPPDGGNQPGPPPAMGMPRGTETARAGDHENQWIADWPWLNRTASAPTAHQTPSPWGARHRIAAQAAGRAHLLTVDAPALSGLAEVRQRLARLGDPGGGAAPWPVPHAARLTRLLTELPTRTADYDRIAPRYGGRTLRRFLDDILDCDARNDFPASWHARVAADWGAIKVVLNTVYEALTSRNPLTEIIADLVEDAYRHRQQLDIICGSRTAAEALAGRLASFGTLRIEEPPLVSIRSISTVDAAGAHPMTLLVGPPAARWRQRLTAADLGQLVVLGPSACTTQLYYALRSAYGDPSREDARDSRCTTAAALTGAPADAEELDGPELEIAVTRQGLARGHAAQISLPDPGALAAAALAEPADEAEDDLGDLEAEPDEGAQESPEARMHARSRDIPAIPVIVRSTAREESSAPAAILLPGTGRVQRLRGDEIRLLPVNGITAGMILIGISEPERRTLFDRIRPLLVGQRPSEAALLLQLWQVALGDACAVSGSVAELTGRLAMLGADITAQAVARWSDPARIGPLDPANVARIGRIAGIGVVAGEAGRIAAVMREARIRHAAAGSAIVKLAGWHATGDNAALDRAASNLGEEITDLAADLTAWRVIAVGEPALAPASALRRPMPAGQISLACRPAPDTGTPPLPPCDARTAETAFLSSVPSSGEEEP